MEHGRREASASDEALMASYASGEAAAFEELFRRYERRAYAYFVARAGSSQRADDLYQELFLRVHRARDAFDPARAFAPWFFAIARRLWIDDRRRVHRAREVSSDHEPESPECDESVRAVDREEVTRALRALTDEERFVLVAAKLEGRSYAELAGVLGKSRDAVKKLASRALQRVRGAALREARSLPVRAS
jgi:RNA polymerase sigma-70 factor (ECF subfamily)